MDAVNKGHSQRKQDGSGLSVTQRALQRSPCDPALYVALGKEKLGLAKSQVRLAHALFRSARFLDKQMPGLDELIRSAQSALSPNLGLSPAVYDRNRALADELARLMPAGAPRSVVDVGGGLGHLAEFLDARDEYFLAEPNVNGLFAQSLPLPERCADFAVSCHVLEHVPPDERGAFLDGMARVARRAIIVLVPVEIGGPQRVAERLKLFIDLTGAKWAKEHLACGHPTPESMREYAQSRGYAYGATPVGNSAATAALVLLSHYCKQSGSGAVQGRINRFFNQHYADRRHLPAESDQYLFTFELARR